MEKIEYFVELNFFGMDVEGVWGEGEKEECCGGWNLWKGEGMGSWMLFWMVPRG